MRLWWVPHSKRCFRGESPSSPVVRTLLSLLRAKAQSLVGKLRSCKLCGTAKRNTDTQTHTHTHTGTFGPFFNKEGLSTLAGIISPPFESLGASLVAQMIRNLPTIQETWVWSLGWEDPLEKEWLPTPVFLPGEFHGPRSWVVYSPQVRKELVMS